MPAAAMNGTVERTKANDADAYHRDALKQHHQLEIIKTLGEGTHGKVVLATDPVSMKQVYTVQYYYGSVSVPVTGIGSRMIRFRQPGLDPWRSATGSQLLFVHKIDHARLIIICVMAQWVMHGINMR